MVAVRVYELQSDFEDRCIGELRLEDGRVVPSAKHPALYQMLEYAAAGPASDWQPVRADEDARKYLENLQFRYSGAYLRAGPVEEEQQTKTGRAVRKGMGEEELARNLLRDFPDVRQPNRYACGASASCAVGSWYGVGPKRVSEWEKALGTTVERSTHPYAIRDYFASLGCHVEARSGMTLDDLRAYTERGVPVIVCVQDWGQRREPGADFSYGHYLVVLDVHDGMVFCQDSSVENAAGEPGGDVPKGQAEASGNIAAPGRVMIDEKMFVKVWHDEDVNGTKFVRFGIAVGPAATGTLRLHKSLDAQGGEMPAIDPGMLAKADFITYPPDVKGSNCGNCQHNAKKVCQFEGEIAGVHLDLRGQPVSDRDCCIAWNAPGTLRDWKEPAATVRKSAPKAADADTDPVQTAELIADILGGLFGEEALAAFEETKAEREGAPEAKAFHGKAWDELKHPRGSNGRFIPKGSAEAVASAKAGIDDIRKLGASAKSDPAHAKKLADHLSILTVKQLRELQKEYGLKASAKLRDELVAKIIDRLSGAQERIDSERKEAAKQLGLPEHATVRDIVEHLAVEAGYPEHFLTKQELNEKLDELGVSVPVQRGEAVKAAFEVLRDGVTPKEPEKTPAEKASIQDSLAAADAGGLEAARDYWRNQKPASEVSQEEKDKLQEQFVTLDNEFLRRKEQWEAARELSNHVGSTDEEKQAAGDAYSAMLRVDDARKAAREWGTGKLPEKQTPVTEKPAPASVPEKPIPSEKPPARSEKKPEPVNEKKPESESKPEVPELEDWLDQEWSKIPKPQRRKLDPDEWNAAKTEEYQRLYGQQEPEPRYVSAADLRSRNPNLDLAAIGKLNREIRDLEMERQAGGAPGIPERAGLQERIDDLKNQRDRLAGVQPGESVSEYDMQELGREGKKPKEGAKKPAAEKIPEKPQNAVDDTSSGAYNASGGGEKPKPEEPKMDVHKIALLQHIASRAGGSVSESSLRSQLAGSGVDMGVALQELESAGLVKPAHSGDFRFWKPTKAGMQKVEEHEAEGKRQEAEKEANKREVLRWNSRKNTFDKVREDPQAIEAWRNTPNRVHIVQDADYQQDTSSLDYDRPVKTRIQSKPIGALMAEGVVADKRVIGGKVEYLLKPHTRTSRAQYEEQEKRRELARLERESRTDVDMRTEEQQSELNRRVTDLRRELGNA